MYSLSTKKLGVSNEELPKGDYTESRNSQPFLRKASSDTNFRKNGIFSHPVSPKKIQLDFASDDG